jgi:propionate catabolism operon transcriptional regulator
VERLTEHLLAQSLRRHRARVSMLKLLPVLLPVFIRYKWPGNVRELENVVERVTVFLGDAGMDARMGEAQLRAVVPELFMTAPQAAPAPAPADRELERIMEVLQSCGGNQSEACRRLGIGRTTLWRRLKSLDKRS